MHKSEVTDAIPKLQNLLLSDRVVSCQIAFVNQNVMTRGTIGPTDVDFLCTERLIQRKLGARNSGVKDLLRVLDASSFSIINGDIETRIGMTFHDSDDHILYAIYANRFGCTRGVYEGNSIAINGAFGPWLHEIVTRVFPLDHF